MTRRRSWFAPPVVVLGLALLGPSSGRAQGYVKTLGTDASPQSPESAAQFQGLTEPTP